MASYEEGEKEAVALGSRTWGLFLLLAAIAVFTLGYLPNRQKSELLAKEVAQCRMRLTALKARIERLRHTREALAAREPETLQEAVRERLRKGKEGEF
ncbi:MAG: hypothetical protein N3A66_06905, partial [Planctomycetota bacterium]|nr:hypothetical protein [Planctomycetota bacterium]